MDFQFRADGIRVLRRLYHRERKHLLAQQMHLLERQPRIELADDPEGTVGLWMAAEHMCQNLHGTLEGEGSHLEQDWRVGSNWFSKGDGHARHADIDQPAVERSRGRDGQMGNGTPFGTGPAGIQGDLAIGIAPRMYPSISSRLPQAVTVSVGSGREGQFRSGRVIRGLVSHEDAQIGVVFVVSLECGDWFQKRAVKGIEVSDQVRLKVALFGNRWSTPSPQDCFRGRFSPRARGKLRD